MRFQNGSNKVVIGHLQDPVTWYGINYTGTQMTQWDFQNKGKSGWTGKSSFVLKVPMRHLRPSVIYSVPKESRAGLVRVPLTCDQTCFFFFWKEGEKNTPDTFI